MYIDKSGVLCKLRAVIKWSVPVAFLLATELATGEAVDPTQPIDYMPPAPGMVRDSSAGIAVNMVLLRGSEAIALVNGRYVRVNDAIGGAKVVAIGRNYVELQQNGSTVKHYLAGFGSSTLAEKIK